MYTVVSKEGKKLTDKYKAYVNESAMDDEDDVDENGDVTNDAAIGYAMSILPNEYEGGEWLEQDEKELYKMFPALKK